MISRMTPLNFLCEEPMACGGSCNRLYGHKGEHRCSGEHGQKEELNR